MDWDSDVPVVDSRRLPPDPGYIDSLGLNHDLVSAVADLVDNSIDADASSILVRFVRNAALLHALCVVDNGHGVAAEDIDRAMTVGGRRDYGSRELGYFGIGMKAASLGQAESLTVLSRTVSGTVGRRWLKERATRDFECDIVDEGFAVSTLDQEWGTIRCNTGTVVRWDHVNAFPASGDSRDVDRFIDETVRRLRHHLGLIFHRIIEERGVQIAIDVDDISQDDQVGQTIVEAIDPFGYPRSPVGGFPKDLHLSLEDMPLRLQCHIWPPRSQLPGFRLPGATPAARQGFYFYRHARLLQAGGWNGLLYPDARHQLARVVVDVDGELGGLFRPNPEKTVVGAPARFASLVHSAMFDDGSTFHDYIEAADQIYKSSQKRTRARKRVVPPGRGFAPPVRRTIGKELEFIPGETPVDIRWEELDADRLFDVDLEGRRIILNSWYRWAVVGDHASSLNDAPVVKAMLYLLVERMFTGTYLGPKEKDDLALWQSILTSAAEAQTES